MEVADSAHLLTEPLLENRSRSRTKLYILFQCFGWGGLMCLYTTFGIATSPPSERGRVVVQWLSVMGLGLLITHVGRAWIHRWGWKNLSWRKLVPRVMAASVGGALVWCTVISIWQRYVAGWPPPPWINAPLFFIGTIISSACMLGAWMAIYFFYHLSDRFGRLQMEQLRLVASAKSSELRALKSQLNPHFIFNALNSMRSLVEENPTRARDAITQLANLLRYSLQSAQLETVPFESELRVVKDYLALEQVRHEERLQFQVTVAPEVLQCPIPPLLLQTLVENAVKYGISTRPEGGRIEITAEIKYDLLHLRVTNPGKLSPENSASASIGLGLANAIERLRLLFGERSRLMLTNVTPDLVVAEALIPLLTEAATS